jgi:choline dehydrogenase-like flavoprotein
VLATAGLKVTLLEAGPRLRAGVDYGFHRSPMDVLETRLKAGYASPYENLFRDRAERDHFTAVGDRPGHGWLKAVGGRSLCWAGHSLRFGPLDYQQWPISYDEVAPYYSRAERLMGVYGDRDGLSNMPDGEFLKGVPMRCPDMMLKRGVERLKRQGHRMEYVSQRKAMITEPHSSGRALCHYCGKCGNCCVDSKYTSANTPIPRALRTGNLTLTSGAMMTRIILNADETRVSGVEYTGPEGKVERVNCRALVLACNSIETPRHLLLNRTRGFPNGLANSSGQVGRNLTSHFGITVVGFFPEIAHRAAPNDDGTGYYHGLLTSLYWDKPNPDFEGTYQVQVGSGYTPERMGVRHVPGYGSSFKKRLREVNLGHASMNMQGTTLRSPNKYMDLDAGRKDKYGLSLPRIHLHYEDNDRKMAQDCVSRCEEIIRAGGGEVISSPVGITSESLVIDFNHWVGTARMGTDPRTSVVNTNGQSHDLRNLFIGDASVFPAYPEKNPTLTNITLSWRMSESLAEMARKGELA